MRLAEGQTICNGKYEILRLIGEGGQSRVWLAREVARDLEVAIKEPLPVLSSLEREELEMRFQRELRLSARIFQLEVPSVVRVVTAEEHGGETLLVLEYCAGGSLAERLKQGPLAIDNAVQVALEVCAALEPVHDKLGLVHRDIKPSNILFTRDGCAKLSDFGLAQTGESGRSALVGNRHPGTPGYMSPEQESATGYLTAASDLYSLGCVLFEMLTGKLYQRQRPGTLPSQLNADVPQWLDAIVGKALQADPWERYETATQLAAALRAGLEQRRSEERKAAVEAEARAARQLAREQKRAEAERLAREKEAEARRQDAALERARKQREEEEKRAEAERLAREREAEARRKAQAEARAPAEREKALAPAKPQPAGGLPKWLWLAVPAVLVIVFLARGGLPAGWVRTPTPTRRALVKPAVQPPAQVTHVLEPAGITLVYVPGGEFVMGSPDSDPDAHADEKPQHTVSVDGFWIGQTEVTNEQYRRFIDDYGYTRSEYWSLESWRWRQRQAVDMTPAYWRDWTWNEAEQPVIGVSWYEAEAYARWVGGRLPTEAEWEYAARGGPLNGGYTYAGSNEVGEVAWYRENSGGSTHLVGQRRPNDLALYDLSGNVWEWCADWYDEGYYTVSLINNPQGPASGQYRVLRGGSWSNSLDYVRCAGRLKASPDVRSSHDVGFRVVLPAS